MSIFAFVACTLSFITQQLMPNPGLWAPHPAISSIFKWFYPYKPFLVNLKIFNIRFKICCALFYLWRFSFPIASCWSHCLLHCGVLALVLKIIWLYIWEFVSGLSFLCHCSMHIFTSVVHYLDYCDFVLCFEITKNKVSGNIPLLKSHLTIWGSFDNPYKFLIFQKNLSLQTLSLGAWKGFHWV